MYACLLAIAMYSDVVRCAPVHVAFLVCYDKPHTAALHAKNQHNNILYHIDHEVAIQQSPALYEIEFFKNFYRQRSAKYLLANRLTYQTNIYLIILRLKSRNVG